jgi:hypothetical protein
MRKSSFAVALVAGIMALGGTVARAQDKPASAPSQGPSSDFAAIYSTQQGQVTPTGGGSFWSQGVSLNYGITFLHGWGVAADLTGQHASRIAPGIGLNEVDLMIGPRYTYRLRFIQKHNSRIFGEAMIGGARGMSSIFPSSTGIRTQANSAAWQAGGGLDISVTRHISIRAFQADYVRSYLPNNASNTQSRIRLGFGVVYHSQK